MNFVFQCAYRGDAFTGYQSQKSGGAVQDAIRTALQTIFRLKPEDGLGMGCAGRTDAGVHATGQCIHAHIPLAAAVNRGFDLPPASAGLEAWLQLPEQVFGRPTSAGGPVLFESDNSRTNGNLIPDKLILDKFSRFNQHHSETLNKCPKQFVVAVEFFHICLCR